MVKSPTVPPPSFTANKELARYVFPEDIKGGGRVSSTAFLPNQNDKFLSVNSLEIQSLDKIADYYRVRFKCGNNSVAIASRKISNFTSAAKFVNLIVYYNKIKKIWEFDNNGTIGNAFKHRRVHNPLPSISHCGIEFINNQLDYSTQKKIARRLSGKRPHLYKV